MVTGAQSGPSNLLGLRLRSRTRDLRPCSGAAIGRMLIASAGRRSAPCMPARLRSGENLHVPKPLQAGQRVPPHASGVRTWSINTCRQYQVGRGFFHRPEKEAILHIGCSKAL